MREALCQFWGEEMRAHGFQSVATPPLVASEAEELIFEEKSYAVFPGRGPAHAHLFAVTKGALPVRFAEMAEQFFPLPQEETEGLFLSRLQLTDSLHLFCTPQQALAECISSLQFFDRTIKILKLEPNWVLKDVRPLHSSVKQAEWKSAVRLLTEGIETVHTPFEKSLDPSVKEGPCLEMRVGDALGRKWAVASMGVDLIHGRSLSGVMLKGSLFGSVERLVALLLENGVDLNRIVRRAKPG